MKCPRCAHLESKVLDSRPIEESIRRRRECVSCGFRFTTYEKIEQRPIYIIKKSGHREQFNPAKVRAGLIKACVKRPVSSEQIEGVVSAIELELRAIPKEEIESSVVGELILKHLRGLDEVAYVRFASVYRKFKDIDSFMEELKRLASDQHRELT